ncbi:MAG TPA: 23S rRNA (adenine(2030)-N(6))-methyltransferase RlmJ, partial [Spongiibacteraceae bacterium]
MLKHCVLMFVIDYLKQKEKPLWYVDTHAGAGAYDLNSIEAKKNAEFSGGIELLFAQRAILPPALQLYIDAIENFRARAPHGYPGSPWLAAHLLRAQDRLRLFEMHPQDFDILQEIMVHDRRVAVAASDGFAGLKALLPPPSRRALVLIDPPYELKEDYARVVAVLSDALRRFATGTYMVWYPLLPRVESARLPERLATLNHNALRIELRIDEPRGDFGMYGSGMYV